MALRGHGPTCPSPPSQGPVRVWVGATRWEGTGEAAPSSAPHLQDGAGSQLPFPKLLLSPAELTPGVSHADKDLLLLCQIHLENGFERDINRSTGKIAQPGPNHLLGCRAGQLCMWREEQGRTHTSARTWPGALLTHSKTRFKCL